MSIDWTLGLVTIPAIAVGGPVTSSEGLVLFYSYSHEDEELQLQLTAHLAILRRKGVIREWSFRMISPGAEWGSEIHRVLDSAQIILLLISADFLASDYCYETEMVHALERHRRGEAVVIPVILRPVDFEDSPFAGLQALPTDARPVTTWPNRDEAWLNVAKGIRLACLSAKAAKAPAQDQTVDKPEVPAEEDFGILDFLAELEVAVEVATGCQEAITQHTQEATEALSARGQEATRIASSPIQGRAARARQLASTLGAELAAYAKKIENTTSEMNAAWERVDRFFPKILISASLPAPEEVSSLKATLAGARDTVKEARASASFARDGFGDLGKLSAHLKQGSTRAQRALQSVVDQYWRMECSLQQMLTSVEETFAVDH